MYPSFRNTLAPILFVLAITGCSTTSGSYTELQRTTLTSIEDLGLAVDLLTQPRGGFAKLTAAIARFAPGLGGSVAYALYDLALASVVLGTCVLFATDQMDFYTRLAERLLDWGGHVRWS
jgi:hypothetical protein